MERGSIVAGRFRVGDILDVSHTTVTFRAHHLGLECDVALEVMLSSDDDPRARDRFVRQVDALSQLDHPNCVRVIDAGTTEDGKPFIVTELVDGTPLREIVGTHAPLDRIVLLCRQVLLGLQHAHERGVLHGELGLDSVRIVEDFAGREQVKLLGFRGAEPGQLIGDAAIDISAFGRLLECLLGDPDRGAPRPAALAELVRRFQQEPRRFASASAAADALVAAASAQPSPTLRLRPRPVATSELEPMPRSRARSIALTSATILALLAVPAAWVLGSRQAAVAAEAERPEIAADVPTLASSPAAPPSSSDAPSREIHDIERALARGDLRRADLLLADELDAAPHDARLQWLEGRRLAADGMARRALDHYAAAMELEPTLVDDVDFYAELVTLLREPINRDAAIDVALQRMGRRGDRYIVERLNATAFPLDFATRQRALTHLSQVPAMRTLVDDALQVRLDLRQAAQAQDPCATYRAAIERALVVGGSETLEDVRSSMVPQGTTTPECQGLGALRDDVVAALERQRGGV